MNSPAPRPSINFACRTIAALAMVGLFLSSWTGWVQAAESKLPLSRWERSVVTVEVARKQYDYYQPWSQRTRRVQKTGIVVGDKQILTTADEMFDRTLVRLQKQGRGIWVVGDALWIDYHANLALVTTTNEDFWHDLTPAKLGGPLPADGNLQILRWREGNLENRRAEFTQFTVRESQLSAISKVVLEVSSEIQGVGWGEPIIADSHVVGLVRAQENRNCTATPASYITSLLEARKKGTYHGLGYFHFYWQPSQNPATLARLKLPGKPRGVVIIDVPDRPDGAPQVVKKDDILLRIDGFDLDIQGDYDDPEFGHLMLENLSTRQKWAGDDVKLQVWRDGKQLDVTYRLPRYDYTNSLVPLANYDQEPEYLITGGLVFQPLTVSYLQSWGSDWKRRGPFRLNYYTTEPATKDRPELLLMSQVLPDPYNIGYQDLRSLVVDTVNGRRVSRLADLRAALEHPVNGFHVIEFVPGDTTRRMVLAAGASEREANTRILQRYGIAEASHLIEPGK